LIPQRPNQSLDTGGIIEFSKMHSDEHTKGKVVWIPCMHMDMLMHVNWKPKQILFTKQCLRKHRAYHTLTML